MYLRDSDNYEKICSLIKRLRSYSCSYTYVSPEKLIIIYNVTIYSIILFKHCALIISALM